MATFKTILYIITGIVILFYTIVKIIEKIQRNKYKKYKKEGR